MIIIDRNTGESLYTSPLDEETRKRMKAAVVRAFIGMHPETIAEAVDKYQRETGIA